MLPNHGAGRKQLTPIPSPPYACDGVAAGRIRAIG